MRLTDATNSTKIESEKYRMGVHKIHKTSPSGSKFAEVNLSKCHFHNLNISGCSFDDVNMSGRRACHANLVGLCVDQADLASGSIINVRLEAATIDGIAVTDLLAYWRVGRGANSV